MVHLKGWNMSSIFEKIIFEEKWADDAARPKGAPNTNGLFLVNFFPILLSLSRRLITFEIGF